LCVCRLGTLRVTVTVSRGVPVGEAGCLADSMSARGTWRVGAAMPLRTPVLC
jgi:hypothetical protein